MNRFEIAKKRREYIRRKINTVGYLSIDEIRILFSSSDEVRKALIDEDLRILQETEDWLIRYDTLTQSWFNVENSLVFDVLQRLLPNQQKVCAARLAVGLLAGLEKTQEQDRKRKRQGLVGIPTQQSLQSWFAKQKKDNRSRSYCSAVERLDSYFQRFWQSPLRKIMLDTGRTTQLIARDLKKLQLPEGRLRRLQVTSNSPAIFRELADRFCDISARFIGGRLVHEIDAVIGSEAVNCLDRWDSDFNIAVLGTSVVNLDKHCFGAWDERDVELKEEVIQRSTLRIVMAESEKFQYDPVRGHEPFGHYDEFSTSGNDVDLIITDKFPVFTSDEQTHRFRQFPIPILAADQIDRFPIHDDVSPVRIQVKDEVLCQLWDNEQEKISLIKKLIGSLEPGNRKQLLTLIDDEHSDVTEKPG